MALLLSDEKARQLVEVLKHIVKRHVLDLNNNFKGTIDLKSFEKHELTIHYNISENIPNKYTIHLLDRATTHTLIRINIGKENNFHKNADGERIYGDRINIFSTEEYENKNDGYTHYRAYNLPYDTLEIHPSFSEMLDAFLEYTNTEKNGKLRVTATAKQLDLFDDL